MKKFEFGSNWANFSKTSLSPEKYREAKNSLDILFGDIPFEGKRVLDVGCGSGIFALAALEKGASEVIGIDCDENSVQTSSLNLKQILGFNEGTPTPVSFQKMDVLNLSELESLGLFEIVYAWGSLHHTGSMWKAIENSMQCVAPDGHFAIAIYNRHITSPAWNVIKKTYTYSPKWLRRVWIALFYPVIYLAKWAVTGQNPTKKDRGMNFYHDVIDWVGGYPYEYASKSEVISFFESKGFSLHRFFPAQVPTGCNEYVFKKLLNRGK